MKNKYILAMFLGASMLFSQCTPDENELGEVLTENQLDISVTQKTEGDNVVYLENKTPGVLSFWDYGTGYSNEAKTTISIRFAGEYNIKFTALCNGGSVSTTRTVKVLNNDESYFSDPMWNLLTDGSNGKTWVWNDKVSACFGNGGQGSLAPEWWQVPYSDIAKDKSMDGEMTFNLNGAQNFTRNLNDGTVSNGFFDLDVANKRLTFTGANILRGADYMSDGATGNYYVIMKLTDTELVLARQGGGWQNTWMFRKK